MVLNLKNVIMDFPAVSQFEIWNANSDTKHEDHENDDGHDQQTKTGWMARQETGDSNITWQQICFIQTNVWCWTLILTIRYQISADIVRLKYYINIIQQDTLPNSSELYLLNIPDWNLFWQIKMIISQLLPLEMGI